VSKLSTLNQPLVSIVIPTYNHAKYLKIALDSVVSQEYTNWEALVINNYSSDNTEDVVRSFSDSRIKLINYKNNGIIGASRNLGISLAKGEWIAFLDSDDAWFPEKLLACISFLDDEVGLISHALHWIGDLDRIVYSGPAKRAKFSRLLYEGSCLTPSGVIVRKTELEKVGLFTEDAEIVGAEDYHLWLKLAKNGTKMKFIEGVYGQYRVHKGNESKNIERLLNANLKIMAEFKAVKNTVFREKLNERVRYAIIYYGAARGFQLNKQYKKSINYLFKSILKWPFLYKNYLVLIILSYAILFQK
jgi:glycosyltransferase involved in cell wall biosynthesis